MSVLFDYGFTHVLNWSMPRRILLCDMWGRTYWLLISKNSRAWNFSHWINVLTRFVIIVIIWRSQSQRL